jgi:hypothetical protein
MTVYLIISIGSVYILAIVLQLLACAAAMNQVDVASEERTGESDQLLSHEPL